MLTMIRTYLICLVLFTGTGVPECDLGSSYTSIAHQDTATVQSPLLQGVVISQETSQPIPDVLCYVITADRYAETFSATNTDSSGRFSLSLPEQIEGYAVFHHWQHTRKGIPLDSIASIISEQTIVLETGFPEDGFTDSDFTPIQIQSYPMGIPDAKKPYTLEEYERMALTIIMMRERREWRPPSHIPPGDASRGPFQPEY